MATFIARPLFTRFYESQDIAYNSVVKFLFTKIKYYIFVLRNSYPT
jgi:hypothetical protein